MQEFDYDGFVDDPETLDDGFDHEDELGDGFHEFDPEETLLETLAS
jgi:hypothetical protein